MGTNGKIGGGGFHHVAIKASDFDKSVAFYTEALGFVPRHRWGEGDKRAILLDTGDGNYLEVFAGGTKERKPDESILHMAFRTNDVAGTLEAVRQAGAKVTIETKDVVLGDDPPTPVRIAFFKGPDGEVIELFQSTGDNQL